MPRFRDFEASILVDGAPLPEYEEDEGAERAQDGSPVRTVFVEAQTGKRFRVRVNVLCNESEYYDVRIAVDGKKLNRSYCKRGREFIKEGELIGAGRFAQRVPLIFAEAKLMSDADGPEAEALYEEQKHLKIQAGRVVVQFFPCVQAGWKDYGDKAPSSISEQLVLHEKVKKGFVSHTAGRHHVLPTRSFRAPMT